MKKTILLGLILLYAVSVFGFNLTEAIPLRSTDRQEARIDNNWLMIDWDGNSEMSGYFSPQANKGSMDVFYEGRDYLNNTHNVTSDIKLNNIWWGTYGWHYSGWSNIYLDGKLYYNTEIGGFYFPTNDQIYITYTHADFGMTWVTFINEGIYLIQKASSFYI